MIEDHEYIFSDETPGLFKAKDTEKIINQINDSIKHIKTIKNVRIIAIETWLILDWLIRHLILSGVNASNHNTNELNLYNRLLPRGFQDCLEFLRDFINTQRKLVPPPKSESLRLSGSAKLWIYMRKNYKKIFDKVLDIEHKFIVKELGLPNDTNRKGFTLIENVSLLEDKQFRTVSETWLNSVKMLDDNWFIKASKLNKIRNYAAHSYDSEKIYEVLGINGKNRFKKLKDYCLGLLQELAGIKLN